MITSAVESTAKQTSLSAKENHQAAIDKLCAKCGDPISAARLHANSSTDLCIDCATEQEENLKTLERYGPGH